MAEPHGSSGLSSKKIALVHVAKRHLGLDDEAYRAILSRYGGVDSAAHLDEIGFLDVMARFTSLGFRSSWTRRTFGNRPGMASPAQIEFIRDLWRRYDPADADEQHFNAWLAKYHHVSALRFLTRQKAGNVITALKRMADHNQDQI